MSPPLPNLRGARFGSRPEAGVLLLGSVEETSMHGALDGKAIPQMRCMFRADARDQQCAASEVRTQGRLALANQASPSSGWAAVHGLQGSPRHSAGERKNTASCNPMNAHHGDMSGSSGTCSACAHKVDLTTWVAHTS